MPSALSKIKDLKEKNNNSPVKFAALIHKCKNIRTKKNNSQMAFLSLEDETGQIEAVVFPKAYEDYKNNVHQKPDEKPVIEILKNNPEIMKDKNIMFLLLIYY